MKKYLRHLLSLTFALAMIMTSLTAYAGMIDRVIVVVNKEVVTQREFDRLFVPVKKSYEQNFKGDELARRIEIARKGLLEQLVNSKLAISLAKKAKVEINENELSSKIEKVRSYYKTEEEFLQALSSKGTNFTEFEKELKDQMLAQKIVEKEVTSKIIVTPGEIQNLYTSNKEKFIAPKQAKVRGLMIRKGDNVSADDSKKRIEALKAKLKKGESFETLASEHSEGPFASVGGDMGYVSPGQTLKEIDEAIFSLEEGGRSDIVETDVGYHIFTVEEIKEPRSMEFNEVSDFLRQQLFARKFEEELVKWLEEKRKNAYISYK